MKNRSTAWRLALKVTRWLAIIMCTAWALIMVYALWHDPAEIRSWLKLIAALWFVVILADGLKTGPNRSGETASDPTNPQDRS